MKDIRKFKRLISYPEPSAMLFCTCIGIRSSQIFWCKRQSHIGVNIVLRASAGRLKAILFHGNAQLRTLKYWQCTTCKFCLELSTLKWPCTPQDVSGSMVATNIEISCEVPLVILVEMFTANIDMMFFEDIYKAWFTTVQHSHHPFTYSPQLACCCYCSSY